MQLRHLLRGVLSALAWLALWGCASPTTATPVVPAATLRQSEGASPTTVTGLQARGPKVVQAPLPSGLQAIRMAPTGFFGGADPRREVVVLGD